VTTLVTLNHKLTKYKFVDKVDLKCIRFQGNQECYDQNVLLTTDCIYKELINSYSAIGLYGEVKGIYMNDDNGSTNDFYDTIRHKQAEVTIYFLSVAKITGIDYNPRLQNNYFCKVQ
jgi:hypothetical protein